MSHDFFLSFFRKNVTIGTRGICTPNQVVFQQLLTLREINKCMKCHSMYIILCQSDCD